MKEIKYDVFRDGKRSCVTFSYDDGKINDIRLSELFVKYGLKATFNLNSNNLDKPTYITKEDVKKLSDSGFEVTASVVSEYGKKLLEQYENINVNDKKLDAIELAEILRVGKYNALVDASHPYAVNASKNAVAACKIPCSYFSIASAALCCSGYNRAENVTFIDLPRFLRSL